MIYKNITFQADSFVYNLIFEDRITLVGGTADQAKRFFMKSLKI